ncbi:MAG: hypothetical protein CVV51_04845 [Spirochaetae bacterium HGW-Spirochaetae-7]|jgi:hypothetical protein|nr:MAG: hypothetical protein CVV51_04845 [Spirochaetae bacterium HGW-Spirochaetae-7]
MTNNMLDSMEISKRAMDIIPAVLFVVDQDVRLLYSNSFGESIIGRKYEQALNRKTGDILACEHSFEGKHGCGTSAACADCVIRNSVNKVFATGETLRYETTMP